MYIAHGGPAYKSLPYSLKCSVIADADLIDVQFYVIVTWVGPSGAIIVDDDRTTFTRSRDIDNLVFNSTLNFEYVDNADISMGDQEGSGSKGDNEQYNDAGNYTCTATVSAINDDFVNSSSATATTFLTIEGKGLQFVNSF